MRPSPVDGRTVLKLRAERLITRAELSRRSGVSYRHLTYIERGECGASDVTAHKLAKGLGVDVSELGPREDVAVEPAGAA